MAVTGLHKTSVLDSYLGDNHSRSTIRTSFIRKMWRNLENEAKNGENSRVLTTPESPCSSTLEIESIESENTSTIYANEIENNCPQNQQVPSSDVSEKERVRKIFHEWGSKSFECKRVKIVREWIESTSQTGQTGQTCLQDSVTEDDPQIKRVHSSIRRIYGRQAVLDLLKKFEKERKKEVDDLLENQFVSNFGHRHRIQALLKGRFLRNQRFVDDEKQNYVAATASELGLLRQTHSVSDIRSIFNVVNYEQSDEITETFESTNKLPLIVDHTQSDSDTLSDNETNYEQIVPNDIDENLETNVEELEIHELSVTEENDNDDDDDDDDDDVWRNLIHNESDEGINVNSIENEQEWYQETIMSDFQESHEDIWFGGKSYLESVLIDRNNNDAFYPSDDENGSSKIELKELTNRRRVSNLLQSEFGTRLDQLMQSYVQRQYQTFESSENEWMQEHQPPSVDHDPTDFHNHLVTEGEIISGLRTDMDLLQQRMDDMQKMLESCMNMQLQLQQSVKTEVFTALNHRSSNSRGACEEGVCFLCCDNGFESLPDRSAHMYICPKCADNINWSNLKESIRHP